MRYWGLGSLLVLSVVTYGKSEKFAGKFITQYAQTEVHGIYLHDETKKATGGEVAYEKIAKPETVPPLEVVVGAKDGELKLSGGGYKFTRDCSIEKGEERASCEPHSTTREKDPITGCKFQRGVTELLLATDDGLVAYGRIRMFALEQETGKECEEFQSDIFKALEAGKADPFFQALAAAKAIEEGEKFPDLLMVAQLYAVADTKGVTLPVEPPKEDQPEDTWSGAYRVNYLNRSVSQSWTGKGAKATTRQGRDFNFSEFAKLPPESPLLIMWDPNKGMLIAGVGSQDARECRGVKGVKDFFVCAPLLTINEEEAGTGCKINHRYFEMIAKDAAGKVTYGRWERRTFSEETVDGCVAYRKKVASELKAGNAELFWRILLKTGALESPDKLGDVGQLGHLYSTEFLY